MTRKSKQPGGHNPLTHHERKRLKSSGYGTQSTRLSTDSHLPFGHCHLNLSPITGIAVATPSGHIYSKEAIVQYMLTKNGEIKNRRAEWERLRLDIENRRVEWETKMGKRIRDTFVKKDQGIMSNALVLQNSDDDSKSAATVQHHTTPSASASSSGGKKQENALHEVSYWLASSQPHHAKGTGNGENGDFDYESEIAALPAMPPDRPPSPNSAEPLKLKQLIPLHLVHEGEEDGGDFNNDSNKSGSGNNSGRILCAVSHKTITTQPTVVLKNTGHIMLQSVYEELAKPTMTCPVTGKKFKEKDVLVLVKGRSGFAASGEVMAKKYNPTLT